MHWYVLVQRCYAAAVRTFFLYTCSCSCLFPIQCSNPEWEKAPSIEVIQEHMHATSYEVEDSR